MMAEVLPDIVLHEAARALGMASCDPGLSDAIREVCRSYLINGKKPISPFRRQQVTQHLAGIAEAARRLKELLAQCDTTAESDALVQELHFSLYVASSNRLDQKKSRYLMNESPVSIPSLTAAR